MSQNADAPPAQTSEVDRRAGMVVAIPWQCRGHHFRNAPDAAALEARRHNNGAGEARATRSLHRHHPGLWPLADIRDHDIVFHRQVQRGAIPPQVVHPVPPGNPFDPLPGRHPVTRLKPFLHGQAGLAEIHAVLRLGGTQFRHPGEVLPHALLAGRVLVQHNDIVHPVAPQPLGNRQPRLAAAHHQHIGASRALDRDRLYP